MNNGSDFDPGVEAKAKQYLHQYLAGDLDPTQLVFGRPRPAEAPDVAAGIRELFCEPECITFAGSETNAAGITTYRFNIAFHDAQLEYRFGVWPNGKVNQFGIMPVLGDATKASARLAQHFGWPR